ncbi:MAG: radical SAM/SPASM domain-containing protein [Lachnospiraceae bacterium]|nr:radical SAM/SPASM domain-containing protein [Lachnospiraceae bacterium]
MEDLRNVYRNNRSTLKDLIPLEYPLCISIEPSNLCNFKCVMCYHGNNEDDPQAAPLSNAKPEIVEKVIEDIKSWTRDGKQVIQLIKLYSLGEPLINAQTPEILRMVKEAGICKQVEITTNASLLSKEVARKLVDYGLDTLRISVYAVDEKRHIRVTKSKISPNDIADNVRYLREYRDSIGKKSPRIIAKMFETMTQEDEEFVEKYKGIADEVGFDKVFRIDLGGADPFENVYGEGKADQFHSDSLQKGSILGYKHACRYPFTHITVRNDGSVICCCSDWRKELLIGNIMEHSLEHLWNSKTLYNIRKRMLETKGMGWRVCKDCEIPCRDFPEDDVSNVDIGKIGYKNDY